MMDFVFVVMTRMEKNADNSDLTIFSCLFEELFEEDEELHRRMPSLAWNEEDAILEPREVLEHSLWRKGLSSDVIHLWQSEKQLYPLHSGIVQACEELGCGFGAWSFAADMVFGSRVYCAAFENSDDKWFDEVFDACRMLFEERIGDITDIQDVLIVEKAKYLKS